MSSKRRRQTANLWKHPFAQNSPSVQVIMRTLNDNSAYLRECVLCLRSFIKFKLTYRNINTEASTLSLTTELDLNNLSENTRNETCFLWNKKGLLRTIIRLISYTGYYNCMIQHTDMYNFLCKKLASVALRRNCHIALSVCPQPTVSTVRVGTKTRRFLSTDQAHTFINKKNSAFHFRIFLGSQNSRKLFSRIAPVSKSKVVLVLN
jgi:hypothetical protein